MYKTTENIKSRYASQLGSQLGMGNAQGALLPAQYAVSAQEQAKRQEAHKLQMKNMLEDYETLSEALFEGMVFLKLNGEDYGHELTHGEISAYKHIQEAWKSVQLKIKDYQETIKLNEAE